MHRQESKGKNPQLSQPKPQPQRNMKSEMGSTVKKSKTEYCHTGSAGTGILLAILVLSGSAIAFHYAMKISDYSDNHIPVTLSPELQKHALSSPRWGTLFREQQDRIKSVMSNTLSAERFSALASKESKVKAAIKLTAQPPGKSALTVPGLAADGSKSPYHILVSLEQDSDKQKIEEQATLRNEFHHISTYSANVEKYGTPPQDISVLRQLMPFLGEKYEIDEVLVTQLTDAIKADDHQIKQFASLHQHHKQLTPLQKLEYNNTLSLFTYFEVPIDNHVEINHQQYMQLRQIPENAERLAKAKLIKIGDQYVRDVKIEDDRVILYFSYCPHINPNNSQKADLFLKTHQSRQNALAESYTNIFEEQIKKGMHTEKLSHLLLMEKCSFIEEFSSAIKERFFPNFCRYFGAYTQTKDYCGLTMQEEQAQGRRFKP